MNELNVVVSAQEDVTDTLGEIADSSVKTERVIVQSMGSSEEAFDSAARASGRLGEKLDLLSGASSQLSGGVGDVGGAMTAFSDLQNIATIRADEQAQALLDVEQAQRDYSDAVKEFGAPSLEARQAQQALNAAMHAAEPPTQIELWGEKLELLSPIITGATGAIDLMILANRALSLSFLMSPIGLIIAAVAILIGVIVYLAVKTTFFQDLWDAVWKGVVLGVTVAWEFIQKVVKAGIDGVIIYFRFIFSLPGKIIDVFKMVGEGIFAPFKFAFNAISRAWNNTVGRLSFTIPEWIPALGGNTFSMPKLPSLQHGGEITRTGAVLAHQGERIEPASVQGLSSSGKAALEVIVKIIGGHDAFHQFMKENVKIYGNGDVTVAYNQ